MHKSTVTTLECLVDWKNNVLITYSEQYRGKMYCYSLETGELTGSVYTRYASYAIPGLDEENGLLYFYGMSSDDIGGPFVLHVWDYK